MTPNLYLWMIPLLPLAGAAINGLLGKRFSRQTVSAVALTFCIAAFGWALFVVAKFSGLVLPHVETSHPGCALEISRSTSPSSSTSFRW